MTNVTENRTKAVAVVGMAGRFPGAPTKEAFWKMLLDGRYNYAELSSDRLNQYLYFSPLEGATGTTYSKVGAAFEMVRAPQNNDLSGSITEDPGHQVALAVALDACRDAGYSSEDFPFRRAGVFMGCTRLSLLGCDQMFVKGLPVVLNYLNQVPAFTKLASSIRGPILREARQRLQEEYAFTSRFAAHRLASKLAAWNIAHTLNLSGPAMVMDAACSSSLAALSLAARALSA